MKPRELYERHVPEGVRHIIKTTVTGAVIGAGTALAGSIFQKIGGMTPPNEAPFSSAGSFAQREQQREQTRRYHPRHGSHRGF